jgi:transcription-repair coupling factor (superfamily II helicase)
VTDFRRLLATSGRTVLCGAPEGRDALATVQMAMAADQGLLVVARDMHRLAFLQQAAAFFAPGLPVLALPEWDCLPYDRVSPSQDLLARRMSVLAEIAGGVKAPFVVITTVNAALQRVPTRSFLSNNAFRGEKGKRLDSAALQAFLVRSGYNRTGTVMEPGEYAVRGGIIDLFPPGADEPLRLDLFGDVLDNIRRFDPLSQLSGGREERVDLVPVSEISLDPASIARFRASYRELFGAVNDSDPLYGAVSEGRKHFGMEHWLPLFHERLETLFDYLPKAAVVLDHLVGAAHDERLSAIRDHYESRQAALTSGLADSGGSYKPLPPDRLFLDAAAWDAALESRPVFDLDPFVVPEERNRVVDLGGRQGRSFAPERTQNLNVLEALRGHVTERQASGRRIAVACFSAGSRDRLQIMLADHGIQAVRPVDSFAELNAAPARTVTMPLLPLEHGFETDALSVISETDLFGDRLVRVRRRSRRAENFIAEAGALSQGDLVVHVDHGIARYEGLQTLDIAGAPHDCLLLVYDGGDRLFLPVENIEMLSRYGSDTAGAQLDRLGGSGWQNRRARLKQRLKDMAEELIKVAAQRKLRETDRLVPQAGLFEEFCARFPYEETDDQARAIEDAIDDLAAGRPMDRLICGDVGFGKTEVALRAAFVAALDGRQVAVVCPTTLLCRQHFRTFSERFKGLPVRVEQLSRLVPAKQANQTKKDIAAGETDIVVGTHALLAKSIDFKRLGLLIIDEEQHFGVKHKERLKQLRTDVHVLTLSATPIPRTLQLALSGVRELSLIATPPVDRLAVRTFVLPFDPVTVREALLRELYRGGQSFYVCPRLEDLPTAMDFLRQHVPEVKPVVAHGQLAPTELEDVMTAFYEGKYNVLVSTNIVESGLDIPTANTLVVHRADMFGLAQLYQLRGRIGRSKLRAYAYFTLPANRQPTAQADRRLKVLQSLDTLGAGFTLASHDLDLRGAGNLLGEEQSGHIKEVGFELYQELLEEAVATARAEGEGRKPATDGKWSPQIAIGTSVLIPESYVSDLTLRLQLYRRLANLETREEIDGFAAELVDRFGALPPEVHHLVDTMVLKQLCHAANVEKLDAGPRGAVFTLRNNQFANPAGLVDMIQHDRGRAKIRPDQKIVFVRDWPEPEDRLKGVFVLVERLANMAAKAPPAAKAKAAAR